MTGRGTLYVLLTVVAGAAAMLSFAALRDLALLCGFAPALAWLLPVVVDAGAAAGSRVWLGADSARAARRFARRLALGLLGLSVAANALGHGLAAFVLAPPWWVVVVLSGIAPAVLGAMVHLAVLDGRPHGPDRSPVTAENANRHEEHSDPARAPDDDRLPVEQDTATDDTRTDDTAARDIDRAAVLIAAGAGRRRLSRELGVTEYEARQLLTQTRLTATDTAPGDDTRTGAARSAAARAAVDAPATAPTTAGAL